MDLSNKSAEEIQEQVWLLRSSHGRGKDLRVPTSLQLSRNPTIQGQWTVNTYAAEFAHLPTSLTGSPLKKKPVEYYEEQFFKDR